MARHTVGEYYKQQCAKDSTVNMDQCLYEKSEEISHMTDLEEEAINKANDAVAGKTIESLKTGTDQDAKIAAEMGISLEEYREHVRLTTLKKGVTNKDYLSYVTQRESDLEYERKIEAYNTAKEKYSTLSDNVKKKLGNKEEAVVKLANGYIQSVNNGKVSDKIQVLPIIEEEVDGQKAVAAIPELRVGTTDILTGFKELELTRLTKLEYDILQAGGQLKFEEQTKKIVEAKKKEGGTEITEEAYLNTQYSENQYATEAGRPIYVENSTLASGTTKVFGQDIRLSGIIPKMYTTPYSGEVAGLKTSSTYSQVYKTRGGIEAEYDSQGYVYCVPSGENGNYIYVYSRYNTGEPSKFEIRNSGQNGIIECNGNGDDPIVYTWGFLEVNQQIQNKYKAILARFGRCTKDDQVLDTRLIPGLPIKCSSK